MSVVRPGASSTTVHCTEGAQKQMPEQHSPLSPPPSGPFCFSQHISIQVSRHKYDALPELHADLIQSPCLSFRTSCFLVAAVDETSGSTDSSTSYQIRGILQETGWGIFAIIGAVLVHYSFHGSFHGSAEAFMEARKDPWKWWKLPWKLPASIAVEPSAKVLVEASVEVSI